MDTVTKSTSFSFANMLFAVVVTLIAAVSTACTPYAAAPVPTEATAAVVPALVGPPELYLPAAADIPAEMVENVSVVVPNEDVAAQFENPAETLALLQEFGRITGHGRLYGHADGCGAAEGLRELRLQVVLFETADGAGQALAWNTGQRKENGEEVTVSTIAGDIGYFSMGQSQSECAPPDDLDWVVLNFQRYNALAGVYVAAAAETMNQDEMMALLTRLSQTIDAVLIAGAE